ncbi:MAG: Uma2 family endonuclease [Isosphaeraceae bacterium]
MAVVTIDAPSTLQDLIDRLGKIPLSRVLMDPSPGHATEADLIEAERRYDRLYELVDGTLVEKGMGFQESILAGVLIQFLRQFVVPRNLGVVPAPDGMVRLFPGLVRGPDVAYVSWGRFPGRKFPKEPIPDLVPDLAIEVLSKSNTRAEMKRKRGEYFDAGVLMIWEIDPKRRKVSVYTPDGSVTVLTVSHRLDGGDILPGFTLELSELFSELDRHG